MTNPAVEMLVSILKEANEKYYTDGTSQLSDEQYDAYIDKLKKLDPQNDYLNVIEYKAVKNLKWAKFSHPFPMGSLSKINSTDEFISWKDSVQDTSYTMQYKLDGVSIQLVYEDGQLKSATTRGNGKEGENILRNVLKIKNVLKTINFKQKLIIRGEIILTHEEFTKLNEVDNFKNPRNACAGIIKNLEGNNCGHLSLVVYDIMNAVNLNLKTEMECVVLLNKLGFKVVETSHFRVQNLFELTISFSAINEYIRSTLGYDIDGMVIKSNTISDSQDDWERPKNKIAWKFPPMMKESIVTNIIWQTSGERINPVAEIEPIELCGVTISRISLHNFDWATKIGIGIGAKIVVSRKNDVIPYCESVVTPPPQLIELPKVCPVCNQESIQVKKNNSGEELSYIYCSNSECKNKVIHQCLNWLESHDSKGVAYSTLEALFDYGKFRNFLEFVQLPKNYDVTITSLEGFGDRKYENVLDAIERTYLTDPVKLLSGLSTCGIKEKMVEKLVNYLGENLSSVSTKDIIEFTFTPTIYEVDGYSTETITTLRDMLSKNEQIIETLLTIVKERAIVCNNEGPLKNLKICFTGELVNIGRDTAIAMVKSMGGSVVSSVSKNTNILVTNSTQATAKYKKALELKIPIINETEFTKMITGY